MAAAKASQLTDPRAADDLQQRLEDGKGGRLDLESLLAITRLFVKEYGHGT